MSRINQINANNYTSSERIQAEIAQIIAYLQTMEVGNKTPAELLSALFDPAGNVRDSIVAFRWNAGNLQYKAGNNDWANVAGADLAALQGAPGVSGSGTGDMVRATYDPDNDGKIANAQLSLADGGIAQAKIASLTSDLNARMVVTVGTTAPTSPTYPPAGPLTGWWDISDAANPVLRVWDGAATWVQVGGSSASSSSPTTSSTTPGVCKLLCGESIANRDLVFLAIGNRYSTANLLAGGTPAASAGTAANAVDGATGTQCDLGSTSGNWSYSKTSAFRVGRVEITFQAATALNFAITFEVSDAGTSWTAVHSAAVANYDGNYTVLFEISNPTSAKYFRIRQTGGTTNMSIREIKAYDIAYQQGRIYKVDDSSAPQRKSDIMGIALEAGASGARIQVRIAPGIVENMTGLTASAIMYSQSTTAGKLATTPNAKSVVVGEALAADKLNFDPQATIMPVGAVDMFMGSYADLPYDVLPLDGRLLSRTQYPMLFAKFGTKYGVGDGVTTFALPDLRNRFVLGADADNGSATASTSYTGTALVSGGARTQQVAIGGTGSVTPGTPTAALQVNLDPPFYAVIFAVKVG